MADTTMGDDIGLGGKITAGLLLIAGLFTVVFFIIGFWPDKMPSIKDNEASVWYHNELFNIALIDGGSNTKDEVSAGDKKMFTDSIKTENEKLNELIKKTSPDSAALIQKLNDSVSNNNKKVSPVKKTESAKVDNKKPAEAEASIINLNTILLILVSLMGFLGNMIHIATSFTTYIGNETFKRSWLLWYFVKPFTAAALAVVVYFIIRAGFLSYGTTGAGINLYGLMAMSALAGLFTDSATLKLKEVFEVIFKPKDERKDKLPGGDNIADVIPTSISAANLSTLTITGKQLNAAGVKVTIDGAAVTPATSAADKLVIKYTPAVPITKPKVELLVADKDNNPILKRELTVITP